MLAVLYYFVLDLSNAYLFSTIVSIQGGKCTPPLNTLNSRYGTNLKFVPGLLLVK